MLLMAFSVVFMLTACNGDEKSNTEQAPVATNADETQMADDLTGSCWQTEVIDVLYNLMGKVALETYKKMIGGALPLMMVAFALWLSLRLVKHLSSFKEETMGEVWTEIAKMFFLCLFCGIIVSQVDLLVLVLGDVIFPIYNAFLEFGSKLLTISAPSSTESISVFGQEITIKAQANSCNIGKMTALTAQSTGFPESPKLMMNCMVCSLSESLSFGLVLAFKTMKETNFVGYIVGLFILLCFMFVKLGFVFYLIDTIFRFTVMVVMLPLMIMGYPFKSTRGLLASGVKNMLNSAGFMMFFAIIISMTILALSSILSQFKNVFGDSTSTFKDFSIPFICIMMIGFMVISSIKIAGQLCDKLVGGNSNSEFQKSAKALIVGAVKFIASSGMKIASMLIPSSLRNGVMNKVEKLLNLKNKAGGSLNKLQGK